MIQCLVCGETLRWVQGQKLVCKVGRANRPEIRKSAAYQREGHMKDNCTCSHCDRPLGQGIEEDAREEAEVPLAIGLALIDASLSIRISDSCQLVPAWEIVFVGRTTLFGNQLELVNL